ncbi:hypothetical protein, partial [Desulfofundulus sp.]|uniref:hypothetical protein n=1 Tax=Desulfofundulus sp. TaxID=2282750 RepID=UPI003C7193FD
MSNVYFFPTRAGWLGSVWGKKGLLVLTFPQPSREEALAALNSRILPAEVNEGSGFALRKWQFILEERLDHYFKGRPVSFVDMPVDLSWCTPFVARV